MNKKTWTVYMHTSPNNRVYVGITSKKPTRRWDNGNGYSYNPYFSNAIKKYGWENFKHEILSYGKNKDLLCREEYEIVITAEEFNQLSPKIEGKFIKKTRYCIPLKSDEIAEVDIYAGELAGLQVVEVEFKSEAEARAFRPCMVFNWNYDR